MPSGSERRAEKHIATSLTRVQNNHKNQSVSRKPSGPLRFSAVSLVRVMDVARGSDGCTGSARRR